MYDIGWDVMPCTSGSSTGWLTGSPSVSSACCTELWPCCCCWKPALSLCSCRGWCTPWGGLWGRGGWCGSRWAPQWNRARPQSYTAHPLSPPTDPWSRLESLAHTHTGGGESTYTELTKQFQFILPNVYYHQSVALTCSFIKNACIMIWELDFNDIFFIPITEQKRCILFNAPLPCQRNSVNTEHTFCFLGVWVLANWKTIHYI